jgi:hypothetical protein
MCGAAVAVVDEGAAVQQTIEALVILLNTRAAVMDEGAVQQSQLDEPVAAEPEIFTNKQQCGTIRHIVCICCDRPDINQRKPQMQSYIIDGETEAGSVLTQMSRITFESFMDDAHLYKDQSLEMKLTQVYGETYGFAEAKALALKSVYKGDMKQEDGRAPLAKFFVLYE